MVWTIWLTTICFTYYKKFIMVMRIMQHLICFSSLDLKNSELLVLYPNGGLNKVQVWYSDPRCKTFYPEVLLILFYLVTLVFPGRVVGGHWSTVTSQIWKTLSSNIATSRRISISTCIKGPFIMTSHKFCILWPP